MKFENQGLTLWFGTADAPAPSETVSMGSEVAVIIGVQPIDASNRVDLLYCINEGSIQTVSAKWLKNDSTTNAQYFKANLPPFSDGDNVVYTCVCHCAGRQVPSQEEAKQFGASFRVIAADEVQKLKPTLQPSEQATNKLSSGSSTSAGDNVVTNLDTVGAESKPQATASNSKEAPNEAAVVSPLHEIRLNTLNAIFTAKDEQQAIKTEFLVAKGDWTATLASLKDKLPEASLQKVALAHSLADWSGDNVPVVKAVMASKPDLTNLRDLALQFNVDKLTTLVDAKAVPETTIGATPVEKQRNFAVNLRQKLFVAEPTAVLHRMVADAEVPIADVSVRSGVTQFLTNQPDFNIRTTSIYTALKHPEALKDVANEQRTAVVDHLKTLQRVQAISPVPEAVPILMNANLTSAFHVAQMPESSFLRAHGGTLGEETARQVYTSAINNHIRNEHALITMRETMRGTGMAIIDGQRSMPERIASLQAVADQNAVPLNLKNLFGSMDYCECDDCLSVYSPEAYFVELLQFLRNNNLGPDPKTGKPKESNPNIHSGYKDTPLEKLFLRRPDLGCLELTCENTFTVLPYIDLVNEVMESFVVYQGKYDSTNDDPNLRQTTLDVFNVEGKTTSELLAQPQHINYKAYCILKDAVYPFTLPYHQPIDAIRIFLDYLKTSRYELLDTYRTAKEICPNLHLSPADENDLQVQHKIVQDRAVDAEFLGLTQEEYIILTKEAFWPKHYFEITQQTPVIDPLVYQNKIGVKQVCEYYGYFPALWEGTGTCDDMLSLDEDPSTGQVSLTFVKNQFLKRTGIEYTDLVELIKTQFINWNYPQGQTLTILDGIRFSYRFLQTLVNYDAKTLDGKYANLIEYLNYWQPLLPGIDAQLHPDPCHPQKIDLCAEVQDYQQWVYCYFEQVGKLIVLDSGEGPQLPVYGDLYVDNGNDPILVGTLKKDGTIVDTNGVLIGQVNFTMGIFKKLTLEHGDEVIDQGGQVIGQVSDNDSKNLQDNTTVSVATPVLWRQQDYNNLSLFIGKDREGYIRGERLEDPYENIVLWLPPRDTCDLDKVRLIHLDGSSLTECEYDRIHRFIRLWRKLGWTIDELDKALIGLSNNPGKAVAEVCDFVDFTAFTSTANGSASVFECDCQQTIDLNCPDKPLGPFDITPDLIHQLAAVKKLLDLTGLPLIKLLTFWADISTVGEKSLYTKLFLTHNLVAIDSVFQADANGNYLTQNATITDHIPVLMAALKLKADDITLIRDKRLSTDDSLTIKSVTAIYRHSLLAKILHVRVTDLLEVIALFGDPFTEADQTLNLLDTWGKMEDAGFVFHQLNYVIQGHDDLLHPLAPGKKKILQLTKTLYDSLNAIDRDHHDVTQDESTSDLVRAKTGLLFEQAVVEQIVGLLEGSSVTIYSLNVPVDKKIADNLSLVDALKTKLKYSIQQKDAVLPNPPPSPTASIQVTGILSNDEKAKAIATSISNDPNWPKAIECTDKNSIKQATHLINDVLFGLSFSVADIASLLAADASNPNDPQDAKNTAPIKRFTFLSKFLPFLRERLSQRLIVDTLSGAAGLASDVTNVLLSNILTASAASQPAMKALDDVKYKPSTGATSWQGYLIPTQDAEYTFVINVNTPPPAPLLIGGQSLSFSFSSPAVPVDPCSSDPMQWTSDPIKLKNGTLYLLEVSDRGADQLKWKTSISPLATIPSSALLPDYSSQATDEVFTKLYKAAIIVNGFVLNVDETIYFQNHKADFDNFDFNTLTLQHWKRLQAYTDLRNNLPKYDLTLLGLFDWASQASDPKTLSVSAQVSAATGWKTDNIDKLISLKHFDLDRREAFTNEINLVKLRNAMIVADKTGVDIDRLFEWAKPGSSYWDCHQIAEDVRKAIRARFTEDDWEQVVKPLNDQLREHQKLALIAYLLVQQDLIDWDVVDADSLFEFFLIDVQMDACMQTSRIKQALSSVQLFIQRCLLGEEEKKDDKGNEIGVPNDALDRGRWDWMQRYRVWEANRKVFCYPENWIVPELRDDKSPFYKELESELLQKDINTQAVQDALKNYLFKVDEVANLRVVGLNAELVLDVSGNPVIGDDGSPVYSKLHVFARTRNAPYFFYYRWFDNQEKNWYPWEKMQVDIPSYEKEDANGQIQEHGTYLIPITWNNRLLVFFPQFMKKTQPPKIMIKNDFDLGNPDGDHNWRVLSMMESSDLLFPHPGTSEFWEIKLSWTEYRNGKWTQKQVSKDVIYDSYIGHWEWYRTKYINGVLHRSDYTVDALSLTDIATYTFVPRIISVGVREIAVTANRDRSIIGTFHFQGSQVTTADNSGIQFTDSPTDFHYVGGTTIHSLQAMDTGTTVFSSTKPFFNDDSTSVYFYNDRPVVLFYHTFAHELLGTLTTGSLNDLFAYYLSITDPADKADAYGGYHAELGTTVLYDELKRPYSLYNWEAAFHTPMTLVDRLLKAQQFEQAFNMCHYVLNPYAAGDPSDRTRFWQFSPFKEIDPEHVLEKLFLGLQPGQPDDQINMWRNKPFQPHVVARGRPAAYMKYVAMKYIEVLIAWGDYLFRQDTIETINQATQLYVLASHVYGPKGQKIPKRGKVKPQTYQSLLDQWDAFGNAMVELELAFPFSNQTPFPIGISNGVVGLANVFGFATTLYFCIPDNPQLRALKETIDDRLFKIRHCENIQGIFRQLPLFEPPIDPALLVQAAAQGLSLASVLNDLNSPLPNYRFYYLLQKALEVCGELKSLGNAFLSAKEKGDGEALAKLRAGHESSIHNLVMEVKKLQVEESQKSLDSLQQNRLGPVSRMQYYLKLIGEDLGKMPDANTDFSDLPNQIEQPVDESGLKLIAYEKEEMDKASEAASKQEDIGAIEVLASILHVIPDFSVYVAPIGCGGSFSFGGSNLGNATQAVARSNQIVAANRTFQSTNAGRKGSFLRQLQDRVQQANTAGYEIKNIDKQILTQQIRINIANQEITNQQKQIDNAQEVEDFLKNKYTNQELYSWMEGEIKTLYYQAYTLAYDLAKRAEKVFRFERGLTSSNFIQFGYWEAAYDGLLAGERLYIGLKQLEAAYQEKRGYDFEVSKPISLRQINPLALIDLKANGVCEFAVPEVLFDMDRPGDYMRRIKSVALTIPCVVGPYTSLNCTLRLLEHSFRNSSIVSGKGDYPRKTDEDDDRFITFNIPINAIAASTGQNDSGVFELNFKDERYIPFEGAGAISKWRLELPKDFRQFDYDTITDVVMQIRYTSLDGGDKLKSAASDTVQAYIKSIDDLSQREGLFALFDLRHEFPNEWYKAMQPPADAPKRVLSLDNLYDRFPIFTKGRTITATDEYLFVQQPPPSANISPALKGDDFSPGGSDYEILKSYILNNEYPIKSMDSWQLEIKDVKTEIDKIWLVVRYTLSKVQ